MKTLLVPLDGSALAGQILPYIRLLAPLLSARIHLLGVVSDVEKEQLLGHADVFSFEGAGPLSNHRTREQQERHAGGIRSPQRGIISTLQ